MGAWQVILEVFVALLAVMGFYGVWRWVFDWFFAPPQVAPVVMVNDKADAENLDILLSEADHNMQRRRGVCIVVLIHPSLMDGVIGEGGELFPPYRAMLARYPTVVYTDARAIQ